MKRINTQQEFRDLAYELGVRPDWHEPDEQKVTVEVHGTEDFDNAGFWPAKYGYSDGTTEAHIIFKQDGQPVATVNLATLCSWASAPMSDECIYGCGDSAHPCLDD